MSSEFQSPEHEIVSRCLQWLDLGESVYLSTIVAVHGSSPRPPGSLFALSDSGHRAGSLSGGCIEDELIAELLAADAGGDFPRRQSYGVTAEENARLALPCGGRLEIVVERFDPADRELIAMLAQLHDGLAERCCMERRVSLSDGSWSFAVVERRPQPGFVGDEMRHGLGPMHKLLLVGAGEIARCLSVMAAMLDFRVTVCDPRREMVASIGELAAEITFEMPDDAVRRLVSDSHCAVVTLAHDPRVDDMALMQALESEAFYVGALGSTRTNAARRKRLAQLDLTAEQIARLHGPVGLDIGSKTPAEIAVAICADLVRHRSGRAV